MIRGVPVLLATALALGACGSDANDARKPGSDPPREACEALHENGAELDAQMHGAKFDDTTGAALALFVVMAREAGWGPDAELVKQAYLRGSGPAGSYAAGKRIEQQCNNLGIDVAPALDWATGR